MIQLQYDNTLQYCQWSIVQGWQFDIETEILVALGTDRVAESTWTKTTDKRGWWGNPNLGSRLWQLQEISTSDGAYEAKANSFVKEALQYLVDYKVVKSVDASSSFASGRLTIAITVTKNDGSQQQYEYVWRAG